MAKPANAQAPEFVLDCSVAVSWFFEDESDVYCESVEDSLATHAAVVPAIWPFEVANAVLVGVRRKRTTQERAWHFLDLLRTLPITVDEESIHRAIPDLVLLAYGSDLSSYDASYLQLAIRRRLPLATIDAKLKKAARFGGVPIFEP